MITVFIFSDTIKVVDEDKKTTIYKNSTNYKYQFHFSKMIEIRIVQIDSKSFPTGKSETVEFLPISRTRIIDKSDYMNYY
jgi:hypothetical protein